MSDEIKALELEAARLKVKREQLALKREMENHKLIEKASQIGSNVADTAKDAGIIFLAVLKFFLIAVTGSIIGILALCAWNAFKAIENSKQLEGDFTYRFGFLMGSVPDWIYPVAMLFGALWLVVQVYGSRP